MKKGSKNSRNLFLAIVFVLFFITPSIAQINEDSFNDKIENTQQQFDDLQDPDNLDEFKTNITNNYLKKSWTEFIEKNSVLSPINEFFKKIDIVFKILFAEHYSLSQTLFIIIIIWLFTAAILSDLLFNPIIKKGLLSLLAGIGSSIILAQVGIIRKVSEVLIFITTSTDAWYLRVIIWLAIVIAAILIWKTAKIAKIASNKIKEKKDKEKIEDYVKQTRDEARAYRKGQTESEDNLEKGH